jgi:hypothetical protein
MIGLWKRLTICSKADCEPASASETRRASTTVSRSIGIAAASTQPYAPMPESVANVGKERTLDTRLAVPIGMVRRIT